ncbi:MAG: acetoin utilization protein AcuC, partial [Pseudomonadota bacterium]
MSSTDPRPVFIGSEVYRGSSYGAWHPLRVPRVSTVMDMVRALDWLEPGQYRTSPKAKTEGLTAWHTPDYVAALQKAECDQDVSEQVRHRHHLGTASNPVFPEVYSRPATGAGGALLSAALLAKGGVVHCPGCGTHHGMPDRANGFCFLNDLVLGMLAMRRHGVQRIAYVDIDAHHPDGVEHAFADDPDVLLVSVHEENRWPRTGGIGDRGVGNVFNLPVPSGLNDDEFA